MHKIIEYFRDQPVIRERDARGQLMTAGFKWTEPVDWIVMFFGIGAFGLFFYALGCAVDARTPPGAAVMFGCASAVCVFICIVFGTIERGIAFERDGRVSLRGGITNWLDLVGAIEDHAHIASIEVTKTEQGAGVAVFTTYGGTVMLSHGLSEAAARLAAVQLTIALREMRESLSSIENFQRPEQATATGNWID